MTTPCRLLIYAQSQLALARVQLLEARQLTIDQGYASKWTLAIDTVLAHNEETNRQVSNLIASIRTPQYEHFAETLGRGN